jgi:nitroreductase
VPSRLEPALQALLRLLFNRRNVRVMLEAMQFDSRKMPLGKLMTLLESALSSPTALQMQSARFYTLVPHVTDAAKALPLLASFELVREKIRMIETLRELIALQALFATPGTPTMSPLDARYAKLRCKLVPLEHRNVERVVRDTLGAHRRVRRGAHRRAGQLEAAVARLAARQLCRHSQPRPARGAQERAENRLTVAERLKHLANDVCSACCWSVHALIRL